MKQALKVRLKPGGQEFYLSWREREIFLTLKEASPMLVKYTTLQEKASCTFSTVKHIISALQPLVVHEGGLIDVVKGSGYRLVRTEKFE